MSRFSHVTFISAGAGSGKTYRLTQELQHALVEGGIDPAGIIATTFTVKAAGELQDRVRKRLIEVGKLELSEQIGQALIGTVHAVCEKLLQRFAFELGLSPELRVLTLEDGVRVFNQALDETVDLAEVRRMNALAERLGIDSWQSEVKAVADKARENDLPTATLLDMAEINAEDYLAHCPQPDPTLSNAQLLDAVSTALAVIDTEQDTTQATASYVALLQEASIALEDTDCSWSWWMALAVGTKTRTGKKSADVAASVSRVAERYAEHPQFQEDVAAFCRAVVQTAESTLERFARLKRERGLIDFADMEREALRSLDHPVVVERLADELDVLLVDEFQDTNPLQLALFLKLIPLAKRVVFVGDVKQAIYAFRGSDPDLVLRMHEALTADGAATDRLPYSWRSRPKLVAFCNDLFARAFRDDMDEAVALEPKRQEYAIAPAVVRWQLAGRNKDERYGALTAAVHELVSSRYPIADADEDTVRDVRWGDIAILARTNANVEQIARNLQLAGVPVKLSLAGLLSTPELVLAKACLRRLNDDSDTIASAEIFALGEGLEPEAWLQDRLNYLEGNGPERSWGEDRSELLRRIASLRESSTQLSPVEIVARLLNDLDVRRIVTAWGPSVVKARQRQRNLDAFVELAVQFEAYCENRHASATLTGFLFWLDNPTSPELDLQPVVPTGNAVHVLTYHASKGMEWPVVVAMDMDGADRSQLWGARMVPRRFNVDRPLDGRFLRYWPDLFGMRRGHLLQAAFAGSEEGLACAAAQASEQRRLAYVGLTRPRDLLVIALPISVGADSWLHTLSSDGLEVFELPPEDFENVALDVETARYEPLWYPARTAGAGFARELQSPSHAPTLPEARVVATHEVGPRIRLRGDDMNAVGNALHAVIAAQLVNPDRFEVTELMDAYGVGGALETAEVAGAAERFWTWVRAAFPDGRLYAEYPVTSRSEDGLLTRGFVDVLVETDDAWVVIDHKSTPQPRSEWAAIACSHSGQLAAYAGCLPEGKPVRTFVHFPVGGGVVEVVCGAEERT